MTVAAVLVFIAGLATAWLARTASRARPPLAAHFPGQPTWVDLTPPFRFRVWLVTAIVCAAIFIPALAADAVYGLAAAIFAVSTLSLVTAILRRYAAGCDEVRAAIAAYAPTIAVPYAGKVGVHIGMWSPWIDRAEVRWCLVARTPALFRELAAMYPVPIVHGAIPDSVTGTLYPHGAAANLDFIQSSDATHVFLGHGDSDKPLSASDRVLQYDLVAVAGQAAIDRFAAAGIALPPDRVRIIGRPQTEGIERAAPGDRSSTTVIYAPTWRHADDSLNVSSLAVADRLVRAMLERGCTVIFRRHFAGQNHAEAEAMIDRVNRLLEEDARSGHPHRWGTAAMEEPLIEAFNSADAMLSDVSGIVVDFMASEKPLIMYAAQYDDADAFRASHPTAESAYVIDRDLVGLDDALDAALGADPLAARRTELAGHYLGGDARIEPARRFIDLVKELGGRKPA